MTVHDLTQDCFYDQIRSRLRVAEELLKFGQMAPHVASTSIQACWRIAISLETRDMRFDVHSLTSSVSIIEISSRK